MRIFVLIFAELFLSGCAYHIAHRVSDDEEPVSVSSILSDGSSRKIEWDRLRFLLELGGKRVVPEQIEKNFSEQMLMRRIGGGKLYQLNLENGSIQLSVLDNDRGEVLKIVTNNNSCLDGNSEEAQVWFGDASNKHWKRIPIYHNHTNATMVFFNLDTQIQFLSKRGDAALAGCYAEIYVSILRF